MLTPPQQIIIDSGLLSTGFNCIVQMPTGSGKTWLAENAIRETMAIGHRCIYLTPLRALADELTVRWNQLFAPFPVGIFTGDWSRADKPYPVPFEKAQLYVMTPELLDACTRNWRTHWNWIPEVDLLVVDEIHLLGDCNRGARLEGTLSRFRRLNPFARVVGLSATLGNRGELADWLDGIEFVSNWRPVPLTWRSVRFRKAAQKPELLVDEVTSCVQGGGKSLVFVQSRRRAKELAKMLKEEGFRARHHHAGLMHHERKLVETGFRGDELDVLVSTSTTEMGLNLPVRKVILYDMQRFNGSDYEDLPVINVWQRAGRAGRPGLDDNGEAVMFFPSWLKVQKGYDDGDFEPIISSLRKMPFLAEQIVAEVSSGMARTRNQLQEVFRTSLAARQGNLPTVDKVLCQMIDAGMILEVSDEEGKTRLKATKLGRAACRHLLSPSSILLMKSVSDKVPDLAFFDMLLVVVSTIDCTPVLLVNFEELGELSRLLSREKSYLLKEGLDEAAEVLSDKGKRLLSSIKMALVLRAWTRTGDTDVVADSLTCGGFEVQSLVESAERLLLAMREVFSSGDEQEERDPESPGIAERAAALGKMVSAGLDDSAATLTLIDGVGPKFARRFLNIGICDIEDLASASLKDLAGLDGVSDKRKADWIQQAEELLKNKSAYYFVDDGPGITSEGTQWDASIDVYRFRRSLDLHVETLSATEYRVTGGLDPHQVVLEGGGIRCDCPDAAKRNTCKHQLAVRLERGGDAELAKLRQLMEGETGNQGVNLGDLWMSTDRRLIL
jgi:helicase